MLQLVQVGIPYPPLMDVRVSLKRQHNDAHAAVLGSGSSWYAAEAFRAVNQAVGEPSFSALSVMALFCCLSGYVADVADMRHLQKRSSMLLRSNQGPVSVRRELLFVWVTHVYRNREICNRMRC